MKQLFYFKSFHDFYAFDVIECFKFIMMREFFYFKSFYVFQQSHRSKLASKEYALWENVSADISKWVLEIYEEEK